MNDDPKPLVPQEEQIQTPEDPGYTNEDLKRDSLKDIASNTEEPKPPVEEKKEEPAETPEVDHAKLAEEAARKVLEEQEARKQAEEQEKIKEQEPDPKEKAYLEWEEKFKTDKNRQPTYLEALQFVEDQAVRNIESKQEEARKAQEEEQVKAKQAEEEQAKQINTIVDDELSELYAKNKLTTIKDPKNPSDQGVVERKALFAKWAEVNAQRRAEGKPEIISATRIFENYYTKPNAQPPGADAPISGNNSSAVTASDQEHTYEEIHRPWFSFKRR